MPGTRACSADHISRHRLSSESVSFAALLILAGYASWQGLNTPRGGKNLPRNQLSLRMLSVRGHLTLVLLLWHLKQQRESLGG